ncbi:uncharacterized protein KD926_004899 [Aspergillus affinis]|uniref:uncharacterized protein n=1 Tax=Aspergillus affinis TaxID=1070780 RepID=UPI0022FF0364|nr:uncharacterized protein KD926_004899 [Aspergillus affinis]KAI9042834.1 hypothetical protein KD926_004899 [Aspergillus affinis]
MCGPLYIDPSIQVTRYSGRILPGETPIQAAVRRHHERMSIDETERDRKGSFSDDNPRPPEKVKNDKDFQVEEVEEKIPEVGESEVFENRRRRSSWGDRWKGFKRHYLP